MALLSITKIAQNTEKSPGDWETCSYSNSTEKPSAKDGEKNNYNNWLRGRVETVDLLRISRRLQEIRGDLLSLILLYTHMQMHAEYNNAIIKKSEDIFKKIYLSLYLKGFVCERELETEQNCNILTPPTLMAISVMSLSFSRIAQPEAWRPSLLDAGFLWRILSPTGLQTQSGDPKAPSAGWWLSLPHLVSNSSELQLTDFLSSPSYIILQSPTQSLEWHVWLSSSGNNCHTV